MESNAHFEPHKKKIRIRLICYSELGTKIRRHILDLGYTQRCSDLTHYKCCLSGNNENRYGLENKSKQRGALPSLRCR